MGWCTYFFQKPLARPTFDRTCFEEITISQSFGNILLPPVLECLHACALSIYSLDPLQTLFDFNLSTLWLMYCLIHWVPYLLWHKAHTSTYLVKELILRYLSLDSGDAAWNHIDDINLFPALFDCIHARSFTMLCLTGSPIHLPTW